MIGLELVADAETRAPLPAADVVDIWEHIKDMGVLIGKGGYFGNVIPPSFPSFLFFPFLFLEGQNQPRKLGSLIGPPVDKPSPLVPTSYIIIIFFNLGFKTESSSFIPRRRVRWFFFVSASRSSFLFCKSDAHGNFHRRSNASTWLNNGTGINHSSWRNTVSIARLAARGTVGTSGHRVMNFFLFLFFFTRRRRAGVPHQTADVHHQRGRRLHRGGHAQSVRHLRRKVSEGRFDENFFFFSSSSTFSSHSITKKIPGSLLAATLIRVDIFRSVQSGQYGSIAIVSM